MVREDEHQRVFGQRLEEAADLVVEVSVVVADHVLERAVGLVQDVLGVVVLPEAVLEPVQADLDELEVIPLLVPEEVPHDLEVLAAHGVDLVLEPGLVVGPEVLDVDRIRTDEPLDLALRARPGA